jgi:uncharacterized protein
LTHQAPLVFGAGLGHISHWLAYNAPLSREIGRAADMRATMSNYDPNAAYGQWGAPAARVDQAALDQGLRSYMLGIYNHMAVGLAVSAFVAIGFFFMATMGTPAGRLSNGVTLTSFGVAIYTTWLKYVIMFVPLVFLLGISFMASKMSPATTTLVYYAFTAIMGASLSYIFIVYKIGSIAQVLFITAAAFGAMSIWGYTTKKDLSGFGKFLMIGLFGLIIASIVGIFMKSTALQFAINVIGVLIFAGLTAYDTQRLKEEYYYVAGDYGAQAVSSVWGALSLYLNFVNMFQMLLSLFGNRE